MPSAIAENGASHENRDSMIKRKKVADGGSTSRLKGGYGSRLFAPFRTIGLVSSTPVPFTSIPLGKTTFQITTSVGRCLQTYDLTRGLNLVFVTRPQTPGIITATIAWRDKVFAAWGPDGSGASGIWVFRRGKKIDELEMPRGPQESIKQLLIFGSWIVACCENQILVWRSTSYEHYTTLVPSGLRTGKNKGTLSGAMCTMPTFLNKIFVGRQGGSVEIWNVGTGKLIYTIIPPSSDVGAVSALQPAPALSMLAIAFEAGPVLIQNVVMDKIILEIGAGATSTGPISSISFRTDGMGAGLEGREAGVMATSSSYSGDVQFWDLNKGGRLMGVLRGAHFLPSTKAGAVGGGINRVEFLVGQPVIVTSGMDNSLKTWIFDESPFSPIPRILHSRSGHAAPVTKITFLPSDADGADYIGKWLLSAARDRTLWGWSLRRDGQSTELSQGNIRKKGKKWGMLSSNAASEARGSLEELRAPEITCIAISLNRDGGMGAAPNAGTIWSNTRINDRKKGASDSAANGLTGWESIVTGHKDDSLARTWFWGRKRAGRWAFETGDGGNVTSVAITACGTFALVGSSLGGIDMFNLQSGQHRQRFPAKVSSKQAERLKAQRTNGNNDTILIQARELIYQRGEGKHKGAISGLVVDSINRKVISCGLDGTLKFWDFSTGRLLKETTWPPYTAITGLRYHAPNDLIALSCEDLSIKVVDIETKKIVRELRGSTGKINDLCFSNDGRWIIATAMDSIVRVWDLPTGHLVDAVRHASPCTALAFSNTGEFLATAHIEEIGVNIWSNRTLFKHVPTRPITEQEIAEIENPTVSGEGSAGLIEAAYDEDREDYALPVTAESTGIEQLSEDLMSLSLVPKSRWQTLVQLDQIRQRNKPKEPPKAPEKAPFFLSSLDSSKKENSLSKEVTVADISRISKLTGDQTRSERPFTQLLHESATTGDYTPFITHFATLPPSSADLEIRSLHADTDELTAFIHALTERLRRKQNYELIQAWMTVFLRIHGDQVSRDEKLRDALREWRSCQESEAKRLGELTGYCSGVLGFLRSGP
ncbi:MAG: hypothetical protein M1816_004945 [Peltula sp. TS41687]|nr:MAG: hypothetical protein M1816_004945 [Peltula sp. TS41687]